MRLYVRSRSKAVAGGPGYVWLPHEPSVARAIESHGNLLSNQSRTLLIWAEWVQLRGTRYHVYLSGLDAGYADDLGRPIKHTLLWCDALDSQARGLASAFLQDAADLEAKIRHCVWPDPDLAFVYSEAEIGALFHEQNLARRCRAVPHAQTLETKAHALRLLGSYRLPSLITALPCTRLEGFVLAIGPRLSLVSILGSSKHPFLKLAGDSLALAQDAL